MQQQTGIPTRHIMSNNSRIDSWRHSIPSRFEREDPFANDGFEPRCSTRLVGFGTTPSSLSTGANPCPDLSRGLCSYQGQRSQLQTRAITASLRTACAWLRVDASLAIDCGRQTDRRSDPGKEAQTGPVQEPPPQGARPSTASGNPRAAETKVLVCRGPRIRTNSLAIVPPAKRVWSFADPN